MSKKNNSGKFLINLVLLSACVGIIAGVSVPSLKHKNKREYFQEVTGSALSITNTIEKCLGLERDSMLCDTPEKLLSYGYSEVEIKLNALVDDAEIIFESDKYTVTLTPPKENQKTPDILPSHNLIRVAEIIDRNGRPVIEKWTTDPQSGCMIAGLC